MKYEAATREVEHLPSGWAQADLGSVVEILDSRRKPVNSNERAERPGDVPYYGATGQVGWINKHLFDEELVLLGEDGAPFLDRNRPVAYMIRGKSWVNNHAHVLRGGPSVVNGLLMHQLNAVDYHPFVTGTTRLKLPQAPMRKIPLRIPPVREQHRIVVEIEKQFTRLDEVVATLQAVKAKLKRARASVLKAATEGRLVPTEAELARAEGRGYEPAAVLLRRILDDQRQGWRTGTVLTPTDSSQGSRIALPEGWALVTIDQLLSEPLRNGKSAKASEDGSGIRTLTLSAVTNRAFVEENTKLTVARAEEVADLWLEPGDILVERSNTPELVGTAALYEGPQRWAVFPDLLIRVRVSRHLVPRWIDTVLRSEPLRRYLTSRAQGIAGSMPKVSQTTVAGAFVPLPPVAEQTRIVAEVERRLSVLDALDETVDENLSRCERLRQSILKRAFEGKLVPQDPRDEPASELLARIRGARAAGVTA